MALSGGKSSVIAALDVGTTKVVCFIARRDEGGLRVEGIGYQVSKGMRAGGVVDMDAVETCIRSAVDAAERMAGLTVRSAYLSLSGGIPESGSIHIDVKIAGHQIGDKDIRKALERGRQQIASSDREIIHVLPVSYAIDGARGIRDPRGMFGDKLGVDLHVVTAASGPMKNLQLCLDRGHLGVSEMVVSSYAAGLSCLVEDERTMGVTLLDMGGGTTSIAVFVGGELVFTDVVPIGGQHVTNDISRGLLVSVGDAERMKTLFGSALRGVSDDREMITVTQVGESDDDCGHPIPRSTLTSIIQPRIEEIFENVCERLTTSGFDKIAGKRLVLTGGASQLQGIGPLAARFLNKQVRLGKPSHINGLAESTVGPAFATCAGLLAYAAQEQDTNNTHMPAMLVNQPSTAVARVGRWIRDNF